jgi:hypothetical protein
MHNMRFKNRILASGILTFSCVVLITQVEAQLVINELVQTQRNNDFSQIADTGEFIELYNTSSGNVNLGDGWTLNVVDLDDGSTLISVPLTGTISTTDRYFVIASATGGAINPSLIDFDTSTTDFLADDNNLYEIRNPLGQLVDALGVQLTFDPQYDFVTTEQRAQIGGGGWGQLVSTPATPQSYGRWKDGIDTNKNGADFGLIPQTPGASNDLTYVDNYSLPDVDALALPLGSTVAGFSYSWVGPKVVNPKVTSSYMLHALPEASPQGGNAIVAWDNTGGGNMIAGNSLTGSYDLYAYLDTINTGTTGVEAVTYGVAGTTDALSGTPDPTGELTTVTETSNGNTGVGWVFIKQDALNFKKLFLVDFNDGGNSKPLDPDNPIPTADDWTVLETIDLATQPSDWHRLAVDYDSLTGQVIARFDELVFTHDITTAMEGTFYVSYRVPTVTPNNSPPIFDFYEAPAGLPGDFDGDGDVDGLDLLAWQRNPAVGNLADWKNNYGTGSLAAVAVPEPSAVLLAVVFGLVVLAPRKRS